MARPTYTGGRTVYDGQHAVTGQRQTYTGQSTQSAPPEPQGKHRGFLGSVGHFVADKTERAARDIKGIPIGVAQVVEAPVKDTYAGVKAIPSIIEHPGREHGATKAGRSSNAVGKAFVESSKTALQHPLRDPFQTVATVLPIANTVARGSEIASGIDKAAPRALRSGGKETPQIRSKSALGRTVQRGYDKTVQGALDKNEVGQATGRVSSRVAAHGQKRIGGALDEEARAAQKLRNVPAQLLDQAAVKLAKVPGKRRVEQAALELTSNQTTAEEAAAYHRGQAAKGVNPARNEAIARVYDKVHEKGLVHVDESKPAGEKVFVNPAHERLAKVDQALARVQKQGDKTLVEKGVRSPEALQSAVDAPGRYRAGAQYEKPTPAKSGIVSQVLKRERSRLVSLERRHAHALRKDAENIAARKAGIARLTETTTGTKAVRVPTSEAEAQSRLAVLDKQYEGILQRFAPEVNPYSKEQAAADTRSRNTMRGRMDAGKKPSTGRAVEGRVGGGTARIKTISQEVRDLSETKLHDVIAKHPDSPVAQRAKQLVDERQMLRDLINRRAEATFAGEKGPTLPAKTQHVVAEVSKVNGGKSVALDNPYRERIVTLAHAIEEQKARVAKMENAAAKRVKPTGVVGGTTARPGRGFVSYKSSEKKLSSAEASASRGPVVGQAKAPITGHPNTGRNIAQGFTPKDIVGSATRHFKQIQKFVNTDERRRAALETGSGTRRSGRDILVRIPDTKAKPLSTQVRQMLGQEKSNIDTPRELAATEEGLRAAHQMMVDHILGRGDHLAENADRSIGAKAPDGYKWVDEKALGDMVRPPAGPRGRFARTVDSINSAVTAATVYFKVGHIGTRVLTNAATNIIQGSAKPRELAKSADLWEKLTEEQRARMLAAAGQHGFSALPHEGTNRIARIASKGAAWWARNADAPFRFNSLAYELRNVGYTTPEQITKALDDVQARGEGLPASEWSKLSAAVRRADREAISYDRLNDFERRYLTRAVWFYPWIKGATSFTVRTALEHPYKAGILGNLGAEGRQIQQRTLGDTPTYEAGLTALTGGQNPLTTDFSTFSPFSTAADVLEAPVQPGAFAGFLNPTAGATGQFLYGLNQYGGTSQSPYLDALRSVAAATPEQQLAEAYAASHQDQSGRMFPKSPGGTALRYLIGPATPRRVNRSALAKAAARQRSGQR